MITIRSRGGLTSKPHVAVDENGRPLKLLLSGGNRNDIFMAPVLLDGLELDGRYVLADKGNDSTDRNSLVECGYSIENHEQDSAVV